MNKWRILVIVILLLSLVLILGASLSQWNPWNSWSTGSSFHPDRTFPPPHNSTPSTVKILASLFATFLCSVITLFIFPRHIYRMSRAFNLTTEILRQVLLGFLFMILTGIVVISATLSILTIPLAIILLVLVFLSSFIGVAAFSLNLGRWLMERTGWIGYPHSLELGLGLVILYALFNLPLIGFFDFFVIACIGLGATISTRFGTDQSWNIDSFVEEEKK